MSTESTFKRTCDICGIAAGASASDWMHTQEAALFSSGLGMVVLPKPEVYDNIPLVCVGNLDGDYCPECAKQILMRIWELKHEAAKKIPQATP
jgi:hypothetical protein